jgi:hypothetical protein
MQAVTETKIDCFSLDPYWVLFAFGAWRREKEPAVWLALFNGTDWAEPRPDSSGFLFINDLAYT